MMQQIVTFDHQPNRIANDWQALHQHLADAAGNIKAGDLEGAAWAVNEARKIINSARCGANFSYDALAEIGIIVS